MPPFRWGLFRAAIAGNVLYLVGAYVYDPTGKNILGYAVAVTLTATVALVWIVVRRDRALMEPFARTAVGRKPIWILEDDEDIELLLARLQRGRLPTQHGHTQIEDLKSRVREVAAWCAARLSSDKTPDALRPGHREPPQLTDNRWSVVDDLARRRGSAPAVSTVDSAAGRLLVYFPDGTLSDGAAAVASDEFFDDDNAPPWGTWIGYFAEAPGDPNYSTYVLAWIPAAFVAAADAGIDANPELCIAWLDDAQIELRQVGPLEPDRVAVPNAAAADDPPA